MTALLVFVGAGLGGVGRYLLGGLIQDSAGSAAFPWGTLFVNVSGSLLVGVLLVFLEGTSATAETRAFFAIGLCGGYTTFSTFSYETLRLLQQGQWDRASVYIVVSVMLSLAGALAGYHMGAALLRRG